jgi:hypothetical protein
MSFYRDGRRFSLSLSQMTRVSIAVLLTAALWMAACGGSSSGPSGPTPASVSVQQTDLPSGLVKCDLSGDIDSFVSKEQTPDPSASKSMASDWQEAKKNGATSAYAALYTDSKPHCDAIKGSAADLGAATYKLVVNFVIQFKDENSAIAGYKSDKAIFGFSAAELRSGGGGVVEGSKTGLTANSISLTQPVGNQLFYIAVWQNKAFMVILAILNVDATTAAKVATTENGRIK